MDQELVPELVDRYSNWLTCSRTSHILIEILVE